MSETDTRKMDHFQRIEYYGRLIPDAFRDDFQKLLNRNTPPRHAAAGIMYLAGQIGHSEPRTQREISEEHDVSRPTIRKIASTVWSDIRDNEGSYPTMKGQSDVDWPRKITHCLYHSDKGKLETKEIVDSLPIHYETISRYLRELLDMEIIGRENVPNQGNAARWWFVPRHDTPAFSEDYGTAASKKELLRDISELSDLKLKRNRWGDGDISAYSGSGITKRGFDKLTESTDPITQIEVLRDEFGLEVGVDLHVNLQTNQKGVKKIRDELARRMGYDDGE